VPLHKLSNIELGLLQHLDLADVAILDGKDGRCLTCDLVSNRGRDKLLHQRLEITLGSQFRHDTSHLGTDCSDLRRLGVASILDLVVLRASESDAEHTDSVSIGRSAVDVSFNNGLLLTDKRAKLVSSHVHTVKVQKAVKTLNILNAKLDLSVGQRFVLVQIRKTNLNHSALQTIRGNLGSLSLGDKGASAVLVGKDRGGNQLVPFLL